MCGREECAFIQWEVVRELLLLLRFGWRRNAEFVLEGVEMQSDTGSILCN